MSRSDPDPATTSAAARSIPMDLSDHLDRLRSELDRIDELRRGGTDRGRPPDPGADASLIVGHLARVQRLCGWALRAAVAQAREASVGGDGLAARAPVHSSRLPDQLKAGGRTVVNDCSPNPDRVSTHGPDRGDAHGPAGVVEAVQRHLALVDERLHEAIDDAQLLGRIHAGADDPKVAGQASAYRTLAHNRGSEALGARAQLEALHQELAGKPSPAHARSSRILDEAGVRPNPVGLEDRDPVVTEFLREHAPEVESDSPHPPARSTELDHGLEL